MIRLHTLGPLDLRRTDGSEIGSILAQPKRLALLAHLAVNGGSGFVSRDHLVALFWPDQNDERARGALSRALYFLRHELGDGVVVARGDDALGLSPSAFWCDAVEFETANAEARHDRALDLYRGDLLEGFHVSGSPEFGQWLDVKRHNLRTLACRSAWSRAQVEHEGGNGEGAIRWGRWAVERSPYDEAAVRRLMALLDHSGDRAGAVHEYERLTRRLGEAFELTPAPETVALLDEIRARSGPVRVRPDPVVVRDDAARVDPTPAEATPPADPPVPSESRPPRRRPIMPDIRGMGRRRATAAIAIAAAVSAGVLFLAMRPASVDDRLIVVSAVENRTGDAALDALTRAATEVATRDVERAVESISATAPLSTARVAQTDRGGGGFARLERAGISIGAELYRDRGALFFRALVSDASHGRLAWEIPPLPVRPDAPDEAIHELSERIAGAVTALRSPRLAGWLPVANTPPTLAALTEYLKGFDVTRPWDAGAHFERAWEIDTTFVWARLEATGQGRMLDRGRAHSIVVDLDGKRDRMNGLQIAFLDSRLAAEAGDRQALYQAMAVAARLAPQRFLTEYAMTAWYLHLPRQTLELLDQADAQDANTDPLARWAWRTDLLHELHEYGQELALARRVRSTLPRDLDALSKQLRAMVAVGDTPGVLALVDTAMSIPAETFYSPGTVLLLAADELRAHGRPAESTTVAKRAVAWYRAVPATFTKGHPSWRDMYLAHALYMSGAWEEAESAYRALAEAEPTWRGDFWGYLGALAARRQDRATAEGYLAALGTLNVPSEVQPEDVARSRARIAVLLGEPDRALDFLRDGYGGDQGTDLHADIDFDAMIETNAQFREFVRPKG